MKDNHTEGKKMARNGRTASIYESLSFRIGLYMKMSRKRMTGYLFSDYLGIYFSFYNLGEKKILQNHDKSLKSRISFEQTEDFLRRPQNLKKIS